MEKSPIHMVSGKKSKLKNTNVVIPFITYFRKHRGWGEGSTHTTDGSVNC